MPDNLELYQSAKLLIDKYGAPGPGDVVN